jgi:antitoxin ParD1/3/4/toxin ParE1/3/4
MTHARLIRLAASELAEAAATIAHDDPTAARSPREAVAQALASLGNHPDSSGARPDLAAPPVHFCFLPRYAHVLVHDSALRPPLALRVVNAARDLSGRSRPGHGSLLASRLLVL